MKKSFALILLCILLTGCAQVGYHSAYIISDVTDEEQAEVPLTPHPSAL